MSSARMENRISVSDENVGVSGNIKRYDPNARPSVVARNGNQRNALGDLSNTNRRPVPQKYPVKSTTIPSVSKPPPAPKDETTKDNYPNIEYMPPSDSQDPPLYHIPDYYEKPEYLKELLEEMKGNPFNKDSFKIRIPSVTVDSKTTRTFTDGGNIPPGLFWPDLDDLVELPDLDDLNF